MGAFHSRVIELLNDRKKPVIFILWGRHAQAKKKLITNTNHYIIESVHPSPLSARRGFFGSKPYSKVNTILVNMVKEKLIGKFQIYKNRKGS